MPGQTLTGLPLWPSYLRYPPIPWWVFHGGSPSVRSTLLLQTCHSPIARAIHRLPMPQPEMEANILTLQWYSHSALAMRGHWHAWSRIRELGWMHYSRLEDFLSHFTMPFIFFVTNEAVPTLCSSDKIVLLVEGIMNQAPTRSYNHDCSGARMQQ